MRFAPCRSPLGSPAEKKILDVITKLDGQRRGMANVPEADGAVARIGDWLRPRLGL